jgi:hypothetical protein
MRGKIIQYNGTDGSGTIVAEGEQYRFSLTAWRGDSAPAVNKTVEITLAGDMISAFTPVGDDVLIKEKAAELGGKLGASLGKLRASIPAPAGVVSGSAAGGATSSTDAVQVAPSAGGAITFNSILERYGKAIPITWALFLLGTLAFNAASISMMGVGRGWSWFDIAGLMSQMGRDSGGTIKVLLLIGYASIAVPLFWRDRRAWLALLVPLLALLWGTFSVLHTMSSVGDGMMGRMSDVFSLGFGFYLSLLAASVLAALAVKRFLTAS